jgi:NOL1/NOP2/fmu family ribosome biogenesis protein
MKFTILNRKEIKVITSKIKEQWDSEFDFKDYVVLKNDKEKIFISNHDVFNLDFSKIGVNAVGLYIAELERDIRLSIEGSQLVGPTAKKNIVELNDDEAIQWFKGIDLSKPGDFSGFVIVKHGSDFLCTGKYRDGMLLNFCPKTRRINPSSNQQDSEN